MAGSQAASIHYQYDANGRLLAADYGAGRRIDYQYDDAGNLLSRRVQRVSEPSYPLTVALSPAAGGQVSGDGIACPADCTENYNAGSVVSLTAAPAAGYRFVAWGGDLAGAANPATVSLNAARSVRAYFAAQDGQTDSDGVTDAEEMGSSGTDPSYDGDNNGVPDYQEARVASLPCGNGAGYATIAVNAPYLLSGVAAGTPDPAPPAGVELPCGVFDFTVAGLAPSTNACAAVTVSVPADAGIAEYWKYGPTPDEPKPHWYAFTSQPPVGAEPPVTTDRTRTLLHICNGLKGDNDLSSDNDEAPDPGGPARRQALARTLSVSATPSAGGRVTATGIDCPGDCTEDYPEGAQVELMAHPAGGYEFSSWGGDLSGTGNPATVTMSAARSVTARFAASPPPPGTPTSIPLIGLPALVLLGGLLAALGVMGLGGRDGKR
jgi:YD repeat-containing protein